MDNIVIAGRVAITVLACILAAAVALTAPPLWREALDMVFGWTLMGAGVAVTSTALRALAEDARPDVARAVGRAAFKVARAAYKIANR